MFRCPFNISASVSHGHPGLHRAWVHLPSHRTPFSHHLFRGTISHSSAQAQIPGILALALCLILHVKFILRASQSPTKVHLESSSSSISSIISQIQATIMSLRTWTLIWIPVILLTPSQSILLAWVCPHLLTLDASLAPASFTSSCPWSFTPAVLTACMQWSLHRFILTLQALNVIFLRRSLTAHPL